MSKTEVSGKQLKDGSVELVDLAPEVSGVLNTLQSDVATLQTDIASLQGASAPNLSDLGEVTITTPSSGQVLKYDGLGWVNAADSTFSGAYADLTGKPTLFDGAYSSLTGTPSIPANLDDLSDVALTSPANGQVLSYNGTAWVNSAAASGGASDLDGLSDVAITSAAKGHFLAHNGTSFVNTRTIEADVAATVPLTVKGAASQSSNLFNITDSANSNLVAVTSAGSAYFNGGGWNSAPVVITGEIGNNPAFNIRGVVAGGSGNYGLLRIMGSGTGIIDFETSNSAGGSWNGRILGGAGLITIGTSSGASRGYPAWFGGWDATYPSLSLVALNAAAKGLVVKGAASQTGHLLELQNSAGTWQTRLTSTGLLRFNYAASTVPIMVSNQWDEVMFQVAIGANSATSNSTIKLGTQVYQYSEFGFEGGTGSNGSFKIWGRADRCFALQSPDNGSGVYTFDVSRNTATALWNFNQGGTSAGFNFNVSSGSTGGLGVNLTSAAAASLHVVNNLAAKKGMIVKGAASQTANLFETQNSSGTALTYIDPNGYLNSYLGYVNSVYVGIRNNGRAVYIGDRAGESNAATSQDNVAVGFEAARYNTTGYENVVVGKSAMGVANSTAYRNTAVGYYAGAYMTSAFANTLIGHLAGTAITTATWNTLVGKDAGAALTTSGGNTFIGGQAGLAANNTTNAVFIGSSCGAVGTDMARSVGVGVSAHKNGYDNVAIGFECGKNMTHQETQNVYIGTSAAQQGFHQSKNVIIGYNAQQANITYGTSQIAIGWGAACTGSSALAIGVSASAAASCMDIRFGGASRITGDSSGNVAIANTLHAARYTETVANAFNTSLAPSTGTLTVDTSLGNAVLGALSAAVTTWAFTNVPTDNSKVTTVTAVLAGNASYTYGDACSVNGSAVTNGIMWSGGSAPTATAGTDIITFVIVKDSAGTVKVFGSATTNFS